MPSSKNYTYSEPPSLESKRHIEAISACRNYRTIPDTDSDDQQDQRRAAVHSDCQIERRQDLSFEILWSHLFRGRPHEPLRDDAGLEQLSDSSWTSQWSHLSNGNVL